MNEWTRLRTFVEKNHAVWFDVLRGFLGIALFLRGLYYATHFEALLSLMRGTALFAWGGLAHIVVGVHLVAGLFLALGLLTRVAALSLIPVLIGAVVFVERATGPFSTAQGFELAVFTLVALVVFFLAGPGPASVDAWLEQRFRTKSVRARELEAALWTPM